MGWMLDRVGRAIARYLQKPARGYEPSRRAIRRHYKHRCSRVTCC